MRELRDKRIRSVFERHISGLHNVAGWQGILTSWKRKYASDPEFTLHVGGRFNMDIRFARLLLANLIVKGANGKENYTECVGIIDYISDGAAEVEYVPVKKDVSLDILFAKCDFGFLQVSKYIETDLYFGLMGIYDLVKFPGQSKNNLMPKEYGNEILKLMKVIPNDLECTLCTQCGLPRRKYKVCEVCRYDPKEKKVVKNAEPEEKALVEPPKKAMRNIVEGRARAKEAILGMDFGPPQDLEDAEADPLKRERKRLLQAYYRAHGINPED